MGLPTIGFQLPCCLASSSTRNRMSAALAAKAVPSKIGDVITIGATSFIRVDNPGRIKTYTAPGARLVVMHEIPGHGGYFMVPDNNLLCGLIQWVLSADG